MSQTYQARRPKVTAKIGQVQVPVTSVTITHAVNSLPYAEFSVALDNGTGGNGGTPSVGGVQIDIKNVNQIGKIMQQKFYNSFSLNSDISITISDGDGNINNGDGNIKTFTGFLGNPTFQVSGNQFFMVFSAMHSMIRVQAFNPSIYNDTSFYSNIDDPFQGYFGGVADNEKTDSIAQRLLVGLLGLMKAFTDVRGGLNQPDPTNPAFISQNNSPTLYEPVQWNIHALNNTVLDAVTKILTTSESLTLIDGITPGVNASTFHDAPLHKTLFEILIGCSTIPDVLTSMIPPFLFQLNAEIWNDNVWLEHIQPMEVPQSMIVVPIEMLSFNLASAFEIPLLQVIVRGPGSELYAVSPTNTGSGIAPLSPSPQNPQNIDAGLLYDQSMVVFGRYPPQVPVIFQNAASLVQSETIGEALFQNQSKVIVSAMPGRYMYVDAPYWVCSDWQALLPAATDAIDPTADATAGAVEDMTTQQLRFAAMSNARIPFLNYLARHTFNDMFLGRTTSRIKIPLCLTLQVGRTYFVRATGQATSIYIGYLESVTHTIRIEDGGGIAETEIVLSHIRSRDAVLTPLSLGNAALGISTADYLQTLNDTEMELASQLFNQYLGSVKTGVLSAFGLP